MSVRNLVNAIDFLKRKTNELIKKFDNNEHPQGNDYVDTILHLGTIHYEEWKNDEISRISNNEYDTGTSLNAQVISKINSIRSLGVLNEGEQFDINSLNNFKSDTNTKFTEIYDIINGSESEPSNNNTNQNNLSSSAPPEQALINFKREIDSIVTNFNILENALGRWGRGMDSVNRVINNIRGPIVRLRMNFSFDDRISIIGNELSANSLRLSQFEHEDGELVNPRGVDTPLEIVAEWNEQDPVMETIYPARIIDNKINELIEIYNEYSSNSYVRSTSNTTNTSEPESHFHTFDDETKVERIKTNIENIKRVIENYDPIEITSKFKTDYRTIVSMINNLINGNQELITKFNEIVPKKSEYYELFKLSYIEPISQNELLDHITNFELFIKYFEDNVLNDNTDESEQSDNDNNSNDNSDESGRSENDIIPITPPDINLFILNETITNLEEFNNIVIELKSQFNNMRNIENEFLDKDEFTRILNDEFLLALENFKTIVNENRCNKKDIINNVIQAIERNVIGIINNLH